ncbi:Cell cycle serine/threonine-protein kinase cdc5/MSD2 [Entomophthora muscae]|uniref:Cell cycle serine/threonine-protein kinase cdc5/MSD2 n=1 Tax=Entomophthora muscae TaxID=34485 RepID=A0ACC2T375_9FUNG|nr:Cell cycle serine/threonine-protein kinase cdc5/MSD2 [Entomophthora muscae]
MELCPLGSLQQLLSHGKTLTEPETRFYMLQLLDTVEHFKENRVIHGDLTLANILIAQDMTLQVGDFGIANELPPGQDYISTFYGTPECMAPGTLDGEHSYEADMWALGIIIKIRDSDFSFPAEATISSQAKELIKLILQTDPEKTRF